MEEDIQFPLVEELELDDAACDTAERQHSQPPVNPKKKSKPVAPRVKLANYLVEKKGWPEERIKRGGIDKWNWRFVGTVFMLPPIDFDMLAPYMDDIVEAILKTFPKMRAIVAYETTIKGELRKPQARLLTQSAPTTTIHIENGIKYYFDVMKVMFAAGNGTERIRFSKISAPGEIVVDMFAGIGYFTLPLSKHSGLSKLIALEKNQDSAGFLRKNAELNGLSGQVTVYEGDNRVIADEWLGKCDRVLMGYLPSAEEFVDRALDFGKHDKFVVHYHYIATKADSESIPIQHIRPRLQAKRPNATLTIDHIENVKSYAPQLFHYVADVTIKDEGWTGDEREFLLGLFQDDPDLAPNWQNPLIERRHRLHNVDNSIQLTALSPASSRAAQSFRSLSPSSGHFHIPAQTPIGEKPKNFRLVGPRSSATTTQKKVGHKNTVQREPKKPQTKQAKYFDPNQENIPDTFEAMNQDSSLEREASLRARVSSLEAQLRRHVRLSGKFMAIVKHQEELAAETSDLLLAFPNETNQSIKSQLRNL